MKKILSAALLSCVMMVSGATLAGDLPYDQVSNGFTGPSSTKINENFVHVHDEIQALGGSDVGARVTTLEATSVTAAEVDTSVTDAVAAFQASFDAKFDTVNANLSEHESSLQGVTNDPSYGVNSLFGAISGTTAVNTSCQTWVYFDGNAMTVQVDAEGYTDGGFTPVSYTVLSPTSFLIDMTTDTYWSQPLTLPVTDSQNKCFENNPAISKTHGEVTGFIKSTHIKVDLIKGVGVMMKGFSQYSPSNSYAPPGNSPEIMGYLTH